MDQKVKRDLVDIVGEKNFNDKLIDMVSYSYDASEFSHRPACAVWVETTEQVSSIMGLANREGIPVIPRGGGTGLTGMSVPVNGGIVLDINHMNRILDISIEDRLAVVQAGVVYDDLARALDPHGFFFPPDPASSQVCTLGGNVATNAGGVKGAKYGTTRDYVLGLVLVLPDGRVMKTGTQCLKSVSGYDLTKLFVGSEGTLGVITEITLKINPKTTASTTALATFDDLGDAGRAVSQTMRSGVLPSVLEILGKEALIAINRNTDLKLPEVDAMLLVETDGYTQEETDYQMRKVIEVFQRNNAREIKQAQSKEDAADLWKARKSAYAVLARLNTHQVLEDITVPMSRLADVLTGIKAISEKYGIMIATYGHAGDGNLHPQFVYDGYNRDEVKRKDAAGAELFELAISLGGTLTGEHGIGLQKAPFMGLEHDEASMDVMRGIKRMLDPRNILNPGKMALDEG